MGRFVLPMILLVVLLVPQLAFAQAPFVQCTGIPLPDGTSACGFCDIFATINRIFNFLVIEIVPILAIIALIFGGLMLMFGGGSTKMQTLGKGAIRGTLIGLVIVLTSWVIVNSTINILAGSDTPEGFPWPWHTPACGGGPAGYAPGYGPPGPR